MKREFEDAIGRPIVVHFGDHDFLNTTKKLRRHKGVIVLMIGDVTLNFVPTTNVGKFLRKLEPNTRYGRMSHVLVYESGDPEALEGLLIDRYWEQHNTHPVARLLGC